jgi:hypothetical protein
VKGQGGGGQFKLLGHRSGRQALLTGDDQQAEKPEPRGV